MALPDFVKTPYLFEGKVHLVEHLYPSTLYELVDPYMPEKLRNELFERLKEGEEFTTEDIIELKKEYLLANKDLRVMDSDEAQTVTPLDKKKWSQRWLLDQFDQRVNNLIEYAQQSGIFESMQNLDPELNEMMEHIQEKVGNFADQLWQAGKQD